MDRQINYPGQVPLETDLLQSNQNIMIGLAKLSQAIFGTAGIATGFGTTQTVVPSLAVLIAAGEVYSQQNLESSAISSLPQDLAHSIVKQGIMLDAVTLPVTPPGTAGFSVNYLVQVAYQDTDSGSTVLPYYNASNPSVAYSGPANSGTAQPTVRKGAAVVSLKAGTAATTGTQTTPAPDSGKLGLFVVTVANGASTVINSNISAYSGAPLLAMPVTNGRFIGRRVFTSTQAYIPTPGTNSVVSTVVGGGGGGGGCQTNGAGTWSAGAGGGGGGWATKRITSGFAGVTMTVGAGGTAGTSGGAGTGGGTTSFGALLSATGGGAGSQGPSQSIITVSGAGTPGAGSLGDVNYVGGVGAYAFYATIPNGGTGGLSFGGGGAPWANGAVATNGSPGIGYGCGGSGGATPASSAGASGGAGASGAIIVDEYA